MPLPAPPRGSRKGRNGGPALTRSLLALTLVLCPAALARAQPLGTAFTYQGRLVENGTPATGAYGYSMAPNYNKVPRPAVVFVRDGEARVVVRRETLDDLLRLDEG